jgi:hypothetical protein
MARPEGEEVEHFCVPQIVVFIVDFQHCGAPLCDGYV